MAEEKLKSRPFTPPGVRPGCFTGDTIDDGACVPSWFENGAGGLLPVDLQDDQVPPFVCLRPLCLLGKGHFPINK